LPARWLCCLVEAEWLLRRLACDAALRGLIAAWPSKCGWIRLPFGACLDTLPSEVHRHVAVQVAHRRVAVRGVHRRVAVRGAQ
jgi:hypothetical protein